MDQSKQTGLVDKSSVALRYGPDFLRLIESPDFRRHYETAAQPAAIKRFELDAVSTPLWMDAVATD
jgi:hypothetical protein